MPTSTWGTLTREDAHDTRKTRGLGLGGAVRTFNDLAVPGIGGLWFAKPLLWSLLGIHLGHLIGIRPALIANAIEALACWYAIQPPAVGDRSRIGGRTKLAKVGATFVPYAIASKRDFYITVPFRQGMVQPLRELELVSGGGSRFNAYKLTDVGESFLTKASEGPTILNRPVLAALEWWVRGFDTKVHLSSMGKVLSPLTPLSPDAARILQNQLLTGQGGVRRQAIQTWVRTLSPGAERLDWNQRPIEIDDDHWADLREGARFFHLRDAALKVLDVVEGAVRNAASSALSLPDAARASAVQLNLLRQSADSFASAQRDPTGGHALGFASLCQASDDEAVIRSLVELDGRGLRLDPPMVRPGPAFSQVPTPEGTDGAPDTLPVPLGISRRVNHMYSLDRDLQTAISSGTQP